MARLAGPARLVVVAAAVGFLLHVELQPDLRHLHHLERIHVNAVVGAVSHEPRGTVLFGSTGTSGAIFSSFDFGHPANVLDHLVALRVPSLDYIDDDACERVLAFLNGPATPATASGSSTPRRPDEAAAAQAALGVAPVAGRYFVVRSATPLPPSALIRKGVEAARRAGRRRCR